MGTLVKLSDAGWKDESLCLNVSALERTLRASQKVPAGERNFLTITCRNRRQSLPAANADNFAPDSFSIIIISYLKKRPGLSITE